MRCTWSYLAVAALTAGVTYVLVHTHGTAADAVAGPIPRLAQEQEPAQPERPSPSPAPARPADAGASRAPSQPLEDLEVSPEEKTNIAVYKRVNRSVVNITTHSVETDDFLMFSTPREGTGSGSILDRQGYVVTNYHVIDGARQMAVTLFDGSVHQATLVGTDANNDLAVLKINALADKLFPITWGDSTKLVVGMRVFAIGNPFGLERTLTTGIVSSLNRSLRSENDRLIRGIIQTDAAINPGNSGGPLLNRRGEMIGITTAIISRSGQSSGIGLAIPASMSRRIVDELLRYGRVIRPDCGIFSVYETDKGLLIGKLVPRGPAEKAGLRGPQLSVVRRGGFIYRSIDRSRADLIVAVDGREVKSLDDLLGFVETKKPGDQVIVTVIREGEKLQVPVQLEQSRNSTSANNAPP